MVDFNNEVTVGRPAVDVERILILQRRNDVIEALEAYHQVDARGAQAETHVMQARIRSLYYEIAGMLNRRHRSKKEKPKYEAFLEKLNSEKHEDLIEAFTFINNFLDTIRLTRIDTKTDYDRTDIEEDNKQDGLS